MMEREQSRKDWLSGPYYSSVFHQGDRKDVLRATKGRLREGCRDARVPVGAPRSISTTYR